MKERKVKVVAIERLKPRVFPPLCHVQALVVMDPGRLLQEIDNERRDIAEIKELLAGNLTAEQRSRHELRLATHETSLAQLISSLTGGYGSSTEFAASSLHCARGSA